MEAFKDHHPRHLAVGTHPACLRGASEGENETYWESGSYMLVQDQASLT